MKLFYDIIEQFEINEISGFIKTDPFYIFENFIVTCFFILLTYWFIISNRYSAFYFFSFFFFNLLKYNLKEKFNNTYFNIICIYFLYVIAFFIFWQNITGMIPDTLTITSFIVLPAHVSFTFFISSFFIAIYQTNFKLLKGFLPSGVPIAVAPFLFVIELISYFIRLFSLAIRLFINILAGHMLLKIFSTIILLTFNFIYEAIFVQLLINLITLSFVFLEYAACLLQAIVLVSLIAIYIDHSLNFIH